MKLFRGRVVPGAVDERAELLDAALDGAVLPDQARPVAAELGIADALRAEAVRDVPTPHEPLVAMRAALAARQARHPWLRLPAPGRLAPAIAVAAAIVVAAVALVSRSPHAAVPERQLAFARAARYLQVLDQQAGAVQKAVATGDAAAVPAALASARTAAAKAQQTATLLPAGDPKRDQLLAAAALRIRQLEQLVSRLNLPPSIVTAAAPQVVTPTTTSSTSTTSSTTTSSTSTTSTTIAPTTTTTARPRGFPPKPPPSTTTTTTTPPPPSYDTGTGTV